jgi:hypothetical protein
MPNLVRFSAYRTPSSEARFVYAPRLKIERWRILLLALGARVLTSSRPSFWPVQPAPGLQQ